MHMLHQQGTYKDSHAVWLRGRFKKEGLRWVLVLIINFVGVGIALVQPLPMKVLADSVFGNQKVVWPFAAVQDNRMLLVIVALAMFAVVIINGLYSMGGGLVQHRIQSMLNVDVQRELLGSILKTPIRSPNRTSDGEYQYMVNNLASTVSELIYDATITICRSIVFIVVMTVVIFMINPWLAFITIAAVPFIYINVKKFSNIFERQSEAIVKQQSVLYDFVDGTINKNRLIQENSSEQAALDTFKKEALKTNLLNRRYAIMVALFGLSNDGITSLATSLLVLVGGLLVFNGQLSFGDLLIFLTYMGMLYDPLQELSATTGEYSQLKVKIASVYKAIKQGQDELPTNGQTSQVDTYTVSFDRISLTYKDKIVLDDVSLTVPTGKKLGLIGASGSGKSTLLDVVLRMCSVDKGFVYIGGVELKQWDINALRNTVAIVDQDPQIINGTILENIVYGTKFMSDPNNLPEAIKAAKTVNALEFIEAMPDKFMTLVGTSGAKLSGGQAQRICLARALVKDSPILLMDEPTSALDEGSRKVVIKAIRNVMLDKTVILSTHDYELLAATDYIVAIRQGKLFSVSDKSQLNSFVRELETDAEKVHTIGNLSIEQI